MLRWISAGRATARTRTPSRAAAGLAAALLVVTLAAGADGAGNGAGFALDLDGLAAQGRTLARSAASWYETTPPADRATWGGLAAAAALGLAVLAERAVRLRRGRTLPAEFAARFLERLQDGKLDRGKALDYCELNPSPAARVALAAVRRWGRPTTDLERAVSLAHRVEAGRLRRNVGTLRRVAALAPLLGLLGTLVAAARALAAPGASWAPATAAALGPLTAGVAIAVLALVAYDGLTVRVETLAEALDRIGFETVDAIVMASPADPRPFAPQPTGPARTPHQPPSKIRMEIPSPGPRVPDVEDFD